MTSFIKAKLNKSYIQKNILLKKYQCIQYFTNSRRQNKTFGVYLSQKYLNVIEMDILSNILSFVSSITLFCIIITGNKHLTIVLLMLTIWFCTLYVLSWTITFSFFEIRTPKFSYFLLL